MLDGLGSTLGLLWHSRSTFTGRRWRLFACACARRLPTAGRQPLRGAIELVERFADGEASAHQLAAMRFGVRNNPDSPAAILCWAPDADHWDVVRRFVHWILGAEGGLGAWEKHTPYLDLLREMAGPIPSPAPPAPGMLAWDGGTVKSLALGIYLSRDWERMPILGDALEEAGCVDAEVMTHCRSGGPHARGCWVVDWLLGKK